MHSESILIGEAAKILSCPDHQVRHAFDEIWPETNRSGRYRLIPRSRLCELAAAINRRYGTKQEAAAS